MLAPHTGQVTDGACAIAASYRRLMAYHPPAAASEGLTVCSAPDQRSPLRASRADLSQRPKGHIVVPGPRTQIPDGRGFSARTISVSPGQSQKSPTGDRSIKRRRTSGIADSCRLAGGPPVAQHVRIGVEADDFLEQSGQSQCQDPRAT